jgi:glycosyltransferase involved in cell wall biosynthesis
MPCVTSASLRARQLLRPILAAGHTVNLFTLPAPGAEGGDADVPAMLPDNYEGLAHQRFASQNVEFDTRMLAEQARQLEPAAILGIGAFPAYVAASLGTALPLWADLPGFAMAEAQGSCWASQDDDRLAEAWATERAVLRRLDKFSSATRPAMHALIGELACVGRLNRFTFKHPFGHCIPCAPFRWPEPDAEFAAGDVGLAEGARPASGASAPGAAAKASLLRGPVVPPDAFILLWSGSFKPSCDVATLVAVADKLMERYPAVHLVATGGPVERADAHVYRMFEEMVGESPFRDRYHLLGWVGSDRLPAILREADLAINADGANYATMMGGRARLATLVGSGVPIATTIGSELSEWLEDGRAVLSAPVGDADAMVQAIEPWIEQREGLRAYAKRASAIMDRDFNESKTARKLLEWLAAPKLAPDNRAKIDQAKGQPIDPAGVALNPVEQQAMLVAQCKPQDLADAVAKLEADRSRKGFLFSFRRS